MRVALFHSSYRSPPPFPVLTYSKQKQGRLVYCSHGIRNPHQLHYAFILFPNCIRFCLNSKFARTCNIASSTPTYFFCFFRAHFDVFISLGVREHLMVLEHMILSLSLSERGEGKPVEGRRRRRNPAAGPSTTPPYYDGGPSAGPAFVGPR